MRTDSKNLLVKTAAIAACVSFTLSVMFLAGTLAYKLSGIKGIPSAVYAAAAGSDPAAYETGNITNPDNELRGVYIATVTNINFPSQKGLSSEELKSELDDIIKETEESELNAIFFQVRPCGDAFYKSDIFPTSVYLTGKEGASLPDGFDPLAYIIEKAHEKNIKLHAWINPFRVTYGTASKPNNDINALSENNPARLHPEWVESYPDGKLYYNPALQEVRDLICNGISEIINNYEVDGIIFDDYFYPYPVDGAVFDDAAEYELYGGGKELDDWRRENINMLIEQCYNTVKGTNRLCCFGVAPFGIWRNDDGENGGSATNGMDAYAELYCDAIAWAKGGYIDYLAPQIYWEFTTDVARFDELTRWWNAQLSQYPDVQLMISHAAYKSADYAENEIQNQIEFARSEKMYRGSIMYGYEAIKNNEGNIKEQLKNAYSEPIIYTDIISDNTGFYIESPQEKMKLSSANTYLIGKCDPAYPLYFEGRPVSTTKSGYFSVYVSLDMGMNTFEFVHNGNIYTHSVERISGSSSSSSYASMNSFEIQSISQQEGAIYRVGDTVSLSVTAPAGSRVTAYFSGKTYELSPTVNPPKNSTYMKEVYTGKIKIDTSWPKDKVTDCGSIAFSASKGAESAKKYSGNIRVAGENACVYVEACVDDAEVKTGVNSWYYDDYTPTTRGMRDAALRLVNGYYELRMGAYISASDVMEISQSVPVAKLTSAEMKVEKKTTSVRFKCSENVPANGTISGGIFYITLFNVGTADSAAFTLPEKNPLFSEVSLEKYPDKNRVVYALKLIALENYYGFDYKYDNGYVVFTFKNPEALKMASYMPLSGKIIVLDPGHGGSDIGASGPDISVHEAQLNLAVASLAKIKLEKLGASVIMTREEDETKELMDRVDLIDMLEPDMCISIHQNSADYSANVLKIHGLGGYFFAYSGNMLTRSVSSKMAFAMDRIWNGVKGQRLAMVRNEEFPSCLIETGFMTCPEETEQMINGNGIGRAAKGIADGVLDFYRTQAKYAYVIEGDKLQSFNFSTNFANINGHYLKHIFELIVME